MLGCIHPMTSPMMKRMFGFGDGCCAIAGAFVVIAAANSPIKPSQSLLLGVMIELPFPLLTQKRVPAPVHRGYRNCSIILRCECESCKLGPRASIPHVTRRYSAVQPVECPR